MVVDNHVHTNPKPQSKEKLLEQLDIAGVDQMVLLSFHPASFWKDGYPETEIFGKAKTPDACLAEVMEWAAFSKRIIPFFWIDPIDGSALDQVDKAVAAGIAGFKVIPNRAAPSDKRCMDVWERIARANKPILFHNGIIFYGIGSTRSYGQLITFEPLFDIPNLRFCIAHFPTADDGLTMFGYSQYRREVGSSTAEMFFDGAPGSTGWIRRDRFYRAFHGGFDLSNNIIFGTDCTTKYSSDYAKNCYAVDNELLDYAGATSEQKEKYFSKNFFRFLNG